MGGRVEHQAALKKIFLSLLVATLATLKVYGETTVKERASRSPVQ